jgi:hypothetical protein
MRRSLFARCAETGNTMKRKNARGAHVAMVVLAGATWIGCNQLFGIEEGILVEQGGADGGAGTSGSPESNRTDAANSPNADADAAGLPPDAPARTVIAGRVVADDGTDGTPLVGAKIALIDAAGVRSTTVTDSVGAFSIAQVQIPYDVLVSYDAPNQTNDPYAYLGLSTSHPRLRTMTSTTPSEGKWRQATVTVNLTPPDGTANAYGFSLDVRDATAHVTRIDGDIAGSGQGATSLDIPISWWGDATLKFTYRGLLFDSTYQRFYSIETPGTVTEGGSTSVTFPPARQLSTIGNFAATVSPVSVPADLLPPMTNVSISYADGHSAYLASVHSTSVVTGIPNILGATIGVQSKAWRPGYTDTRQSSANVNRLPLSTTNVTLAIYGPPILQQPDPGASLSVSTGKISWSSVSGTRLTSFRMISAGESLYVFTGGTNLHLTRVTDLGAKFVLGTADLVLEEHGKEDTVDTAVDENQPPLPGGHLGSVQASFQLVP